MPDKAVVTDEATISAALSDLLPAAEGTIKSVLMTYQSGLERTLADIAADTGTVHAMSDILRKLFRKRMVSQWITFDRTSMKWRDPISTGGMT